MKRILVLLTIMISCATSMFAQNNTNVSANDVVICNSFGDNWFVQAGIDMTLQNPYKHNFAEVFPKGKSFGLDAAVGKYFSPELGARVRLNWENGCPLFKNNHLEWIATDKESGKTNMEKGGYMAAYIDVMLNVTNAFCGYDADRKLSFVIFPRAGLCTNFATESLSPMVGVGCGCTYRISDKLHLYADVAYQSITSEFYGDIACTGMSVSSGSNGFLDFHVGVQFDLGKSGGKFKKVSEY